HSNPRWKNRPLSARNQTQDSPSDRRRKGSQVNKVPREEDLIEQIPPTSFRGVRASGPKGSLMLLMLRLFIDT
ncbi:hypothetical protein, partial [Bosea sp. TND4EK4]|uniref:hypothetical protein n=1 Tax=Bosea sp. TND4EK4 TaxID=1907408 RepID=UPI001AEC7D50